jgi:phospholipid transport system substrate-binding protein
MKNTKILFNCNKRTFLARLLSVLGVSLILHNSVEGSDTNKIKAAEALVREIYSEIFKIVKEDSSNSSQGKKLAILFNNYADVPIIARTVLGSPWRQLSEAQKIHFIGAFRNYLTKKYAAQFSEFLGAEMMVERSRDSGGRAGVLVETRLLMPGSPTIKVAWQVSDGSGTLKLVDVKIEGISMLTTERGEIRSKLEKQNGNVTALSNTLEKY